MDAAYRIITDTREQRPLRFPEHIVMGCGGPRTKTIHLLGEARTLEAGDYLLSGYEDATIVERKKGITELAQNVLSKDRTRFEKALRRLRDSCRNPWVVIEGSPVTLLQPNKNLPYPSEAVVDEFLRVCQEYDVKVQMLPTDTVKQRTAAGIWVARLLINGVTK